MNTRELEQLEKKSILSLRVSNDMKDSLINNQMSSLNKTIKTRIKKTNLIIFVIESS